MKGQFTSEEELAIRFPPFINSATGAEITGDACTITVRKPDGTTAAYTSVTTPAVAFDSTLGVWYLDLPTSEFQDTAPYEWRVKATTNDVNGSPQRKIYYWNDWVGYIPEMALDITESATRSRTAIQYLGELKQNTAHSFIVTLVDDAATGILKTGVAGTSITMFLMKNGVLTSRVLTVPEWTEISAVAPTPGRYLVSLPAGDFNTLGHFEAIFSFTGFTTRAQVSGRVVANRAEDVKVDTAAIKLKTDTLPASPANEVTAEAARVAAVASASDALISRKVLTGRFKVNTGANTLTLYDTDDTTPLYVFNLKDEAGVANALRIFERDPV